MKEDEFWVNYLERELAMTLVLAISSVSELKLELPTQRINNRSYLKENRKRLRNNLTTAEARFWMYVKNKQFKGRKFRRQHSIYNFILDFYCPQEKLAIELDGHHHYTPNGLEQDHKRDQILNDLGIVVLRFENKFLFEQPEMVFEEIEDNFIENRSSEYTIDDLKLFMKALEAKLGLNEEVSKREFWELVRSVS